MQKEMLEELKPPAASSLVKKTPTTSDNTTMCHDNNNNADCIRFVDSPLLVILQPDTFADC